MKKKRKYAVVIDGNNYLWRSHYAVPELTNADGFPTNAIKGFANILVADYWKFKPRHLAVVFDARCGAASNKALLQDYKGNRNKDDDPEKKRIRDLCYSQLEPLKRILKSLGIRVLAKRGVEADDVVATLATMYSEEGFHALMGTTDKDLSQIISPSISKIESNTRRILGVKETIEKFGVGPELVVDWLMLTGDGVDNVPGVKGIGPGIAKTLLLKYGSVKNILRNIDDLTPAKRDGILKARRLFKITRQVLTLDTQIPINTTLDHTDMRYRTPDEPRFYALCEELGLKQTAKELGGAFLR